jgi:hypothetical protein
MRRLRVSTLICAALIAVLLLALVASGCGTSAASAPKAPAATPQEMLKQAFDSSQKVTSAGGDFSMTLTVDGDPATMDAQTAAMFSKPITLSGTMAFAQTPMALDMTLNLSLAGQALDVGIKANDKNAWIQLMGQWYETPADLMKQMSAGGAGTMDKTQQDAIMQAVKDMGIDPVKWLSGLTVVGNDSLDGTDTVHLTSSVDFAALMADVSKMMQDKTILGLVQSLGSSALGSTGLSLPDGTTDTSIPVPSAAELKTATDQLTAMFKTLKIDFWLTKDAYEMRQMAFDTTIVPPASDTSSGLNSLGLKMTMAMKPLASPLTVTAPAGAKPYTELESALGALSGMFGGVLGGTGDTSFGTGTSAGPGSSTDAGGLGTDIGQ